MFQGPKYYLTLAIYVENPPEAIFKAPGQWILTRLYVITGIKHHHNEGGPEMEIVSSGSLMAL